MKTFLILSAGTGGTMVANKTTVDMTEGAQIVFI